MIQLPEKVKEIIIRLKEAGYEGYAVGGCVRDCILERIPTDWDITTSAPPNQVKRIFKRTVDTGIEHGTVTVLLGEESYEVTTYRIDGEYEDARHPKEVTFTGNLTEDLRRRDFTINAMAYNEEQGLVDVFGGTEDLEKRIIRCVGNPQERFSEDALRMLRAIRFAAQLDFSIEQETYQAISEMTDLMNKISGERIQTELVKLLTSSHPENIKMIYETGLSRVILPEFDEMMQCQQNSKHHCYSVGEHTICSLKEIKPDKVLRLTMLLHDIAKPECKTTDPDGTNHFKGHQKRGAVVAYELLKRLKFDNETIRRVTALVRWHDEKPELQDSEIRKAVYLAGTFCYPDLFAVKRADIYAQSLYRREDKLAYVSRYETIYNTIIQRKDCLSIGELKINGRDLCGLGMKQGPEIGNLLCDLLKLVLEDTTKNTRETLLNIVQNRMK
ncbi:MAG: CCA tRNA nucleotidyltransferase [Lachnospiraceae bacterium]